MTREDAIALIERTAAALGEHFDAVQIMASMPAEGGGTRCIKRGAGNWYARQGMAHEFINQEQAEEFGNQVARHLEPPDEGDNWKK